MPAISSCNRGLVSQVSTGQAGVEVNRDFETLFRRINELQQCINAIVNQLNATSSGQFESGDGGTPGSGGIGIVDPGIQGMPVIRLSTGSNYTLPDGFMGVAMIDATANIDVTLPLPIAGRKTTIVHAGTANTITLKTDGGTAIAAITTMGACSPEAVEDSANAPAWVTKATVVYPTGTTQYQNNIVIVPAGKGITMLDATNGNYYTLYFDGGIVTSSSSLGIAVPTP